jgi:branched-chain amino acid transport system permease protein
MAHVTAGRVPIRPLSYLAGLGVALLAVRLVVQTPSGLYLVALMAVYSLAALGLNIILGMGGLLSVAQAAVMAVGAYTAAIVLVRWHLPFLLALLLAAGVSALLSAFASLAALRVSSHYFILVTLGIAEAVTLVLVNETALTGGENGLSGIPPFAVGGVDLSSPWATAAVALVVLFVGWYVASAFRASRLGHAAFAAGVDPQLAMACGVSVTRARLVAAVTGGVFAGVAGVLFAEALQFLGPGDFELDKALLLLLMVVIGGMGSNAGTVVAACLLTYLSEGLLHLTTIGPLIYGVGIMVILVLAPNGLAGAVRKGRRRVEALLNRERTA